MRWGVGIDACHKLTDDDVTTFVETLKPVAMHAIYAKVNTMDVGLILQQLATLRPALILPPLVEKMQEALTIITEPHKLTAVMYAIVSVSR